MDHQKSARAGQFLRELFERSGSGQVYRVPPDGQAPWLVGVFDRSARSPTSQFSGLELIVMREVQGVGDGQAEKAIQLARFRNLDEAETIYSVGYADGDLQGDEEAGWKPSWFQMTPVRGTTMRDLIRPSSGKKELPAFTLTPAQGSRLVEGMVAQLESHSANFCPIDLPPELDGFR